MNKQVYYAAPLFSDMERYYNEQLGKKLRQRYPKETFYLPQEQASINDKSSYADSKTIATYDTQELLNSKLVLAILDGATIDVGVASEIGVAYQAGIPVLGLYTDSRQQGATHPQKIEALQKVGESQFSYTNLYTIGLVKLNGEVLSNEHEWLLAIEKFL